MNVPAHSLAALVAAAALAACGGSDGSKGAAPKPGDANAAAHRPAPCTATRDDAVAIAATEYIKQAKPKPERFLVASGTDSALGDPGLTALQDKGPTYLFPGDPALQRQVRAQLHDKGDYTTLLVVRQGAVAERAEAVVRLNGHYVGGESDGQSPGPRSYRLTCDSSAWNLVETRTEPAP